MEKIETIINNYLNKKQEEHSKRERSGKFNPSKFGACFRQQIWNRADEEKSNPYDDRTLRVFTAGDLFEKFVVNCLDESIQKQVLVEEEDVLGYADLVGDDSVVDVKSQHSKAFWYMTKNDYDIVENKIHNILQVCYYAIKLGKDYGVLFFISKDDMCTYEKAFLVDEYKSLVEKELKEIRYHWEKFKKGILPPAKPRLFFNKKENRFKECDYCSWKDKCKGIENAKTN